MPIYKKNNIHRVFSSNTLVKSREGSLMNVWIKRALPSLIYIFLSSMILFLTFDFLPINPFRIDLHLPSTIDYQYMHLLPILFSFILIIPILYVVFRPSKINDLLDLHRLEDNWSIKKILFVNIYYTFLICVFRTYITYLCTLPLEKLPMLYLIFMQILVVEGLVLKDFGLHEEKFWQNALLGSSYLFIMAFILLGPIILIALLLFLPQIIVVMQILTPFMTIPNPIFLIALIYQILFVALSEELIFRGYFYNKLRRATKSWKHGSYFASIIISSLIFGLFHLPWYVKFDGLIISIPKTFEINNIFDAATRVLSTGLFGIFMCIIYEKTQSLVGPIIIHGLSNTLPAYLGSTFMSLLYVDYMGLLMSILPIFPLINLLIFGIILLILAGPLIYGAFWLTPKIVLWCKAQAEME